MAIYKVVDVEQLDDDLKSVADSIRAKGGTSESLEFPTGFNSAIENIQTGGGGVDYDEAYQDGYKDGQASVPNYLYYANTLNSSFNGAVFPENFEFVLRVQKLSNNAPIMGTFNNCANLKTLKLINENPNNPATTIQNTFAIASNNSPTLEIIDITEFNKKFSICLNAFRYQKVLKSVFGKIDLSECTSTSNMFQDCQALEDVEFESGTIKISISFAQSSKLSFASIQSIFGGLAKVETQTLTLAPAQKVLQSQIDSANAIGWTVVGGVVVQEAW